MYVRHEYVGHYYGWLHWLFPLLLLAILVAVAVLLITSMRRRPETSAVDGDPLRRAARRYAAGEIERVEFERIQRDLTAADPLQSAAMRLARGEITVAEFDELKDRLSPPE